MQPINYLLQGRDPLEAIFSGINKWQTMKNNDNLLSSQAEINRMQQAKHHRQIQAMKEMDALDMKNMASVQEYLARYNDLPMVKGIDDYLLAKKEEEKEALRNQLSQVIGLIQAGNIQKASEYVLSFAQAYRNSGNEAEAQHHERMSELIKTNSAAAYNMLMMGYARMIDKDSVTNYKTIVETNRPTTDFKNAGDRFVPVTTDPITGEVRGEYDGISIGVSPDAQVQQDTAIITTEMNNETSRYVSDNSRAASEYGADKSYQGTVYASDNSLKGTIYSADKGYAGTVYSTDGSIQRAQIEAVSRERIEQAKLYYQQQQDEIRNNQAEIKELNGQVFIVYKNGDFKVALDENGQPMTASPARREEKQRIQKVETLLGEIEKILPNSTNSWLGTGVDMAANAFGVSTKGATATAQLQTLSGQLVSLMPRMNGPQSDKDVLLYKEMAGKLADSTIPVKQRQAALATIRHLNQKYAEINGTPLASQSTKQPLSYYFTGE